MENPNHYRASSSKNMLQASCSKRFTQCPTCSSSLDKDDADAVSNECETNSSDDSNVDGQSQNFLNKWDKYLSSLSNDASSSHKQAIFGLRHAIEEIKITRRQSFNSSRREHKLRNLISPRMSRLLEFMSENDMPSLSSYSDSAFGRLFEYLDIKACNISRDPSVRPPGKSMEEELLPEDGTSEPPMDSRCPICLEDLVSGQQVNELECKHRFHLQCIERHFRRRSEKWCPVCTYNMQKERSSRTDARRDWRRFWVCFRGPFSRIISRNSPSTSPANK
jgi:Ring finger domain